MIYKFIDGQGTFVVKEPQKYNLYFPLVDSEARLLSSISPNLAGDIKRDRGHYLSLPASIEDIRSNPLCRREFFLKTDRDIIRLSHPYEDILEAGLLYHKLIKKIGPLIVEIVNFIPYNLPVEVMWIKVKNTAREKAELIPTSFIPLYGRSQDNLRDHRHVSSLLNRISLEKFGIFLKPTMVFDEKGHQENQSIYFVMGFEAKSQPAEGQFPSLDYFFGEGDIFSPDAINKDILPLGCLPGQQLRCKKGRYGGNSKEADIDGKEACAAFRFQKRSLGQSQEADYFLLIGIEEDKKKIKEIFFKLNSAQKIESALRQTKRYWLDYLRPLSFDFKDRDFNNWLLWVGLQPTLRKLFGCSFLPHFDYGKGGRGWRDLWQDALSLLLSQPEKAKDIIFNSFKGIRIDGSNATIITKDGDFISDRNRINRVWMDHGVWPYITTRLYLNKSGDLGFLIKDQTYFCDHQLRRAKKLNMAFVQKDNILRNKEGKIYQGSILEHLLIQNLVQFFNVGEHNIVHLENADWNDGLDMAGQKGESVTFTFMYAHNLKSICEILEFFKKETPSVSFLKELLLLLDRLSQPLDYNNFKEKQGRLDQYLEAVENINGEKVEVKIDDLLLDLKAKYEHLSFWLRKNEWLKEGFFNGYYDNKGSRVEGKLLVSKQFSLSERAYCRKNISLRMMLPTQVFAMMSGVVAIWQIKLIWQAIKRHLKDEELGGFRLNTDFGSIYMDLGRAFGFSYGDKENGAFFSHMNVMLAKSLYMRGFINEGFEVINSIYRMVVSEKAKIYPLIPEYFNSQGRGLYLYLTGAASWYIYTLMEEILGIKFVFGNILLAPKLLPKNFFKDTIEIKFSLQNKPIKIIYLKQSGAKVKGAYRLKKVSCAGRKISAQSNGYIINTSQLDSKENTIKILLG